MTTSDNLLLFDVDTQSQVSEVQSSMTDVFFDPPIGWTEVLDCRISPYDQRSLEENCDFAKGVHKKFILITHDQVVTTPTTD